jgi:hypothetical protein
MVWALAFYMAINVVGVGANIGVVIMLEFDSDACLCEI